MSTKPIACTLAAGDLATQRERWHRLAAQALLERVETEDGLRVAFRADTGVDAELRALVAVENECCSWADWSVDSGPGQVALVVRSAGVGIATLHSMFTQL